MHVLVYCHCHKDVVLCHIFREEMILDIKIISLKNEIYVN